MLDHIAVTINSAPLDQPLRRYLGVAVCDPSAAWYAFTKQVGPSPPLASGRARAVALCSFAMLAASMRGSAAETEAHPGLRF